jgi:hypothetical protein
MPGRRAVEQKLQAYIGENNCQFVDAERHYWKNGNDTLVLVISAKNLDPFAFGKLVRELDVDEYDTIKTPGGAIVRFWWD